MVQAKRIEVRRALCWKIILDVSEGIDRSTNTSETNQYPIVLLQAVIES